MSAGPVTAVGVFDSGVGGLSVWRALRAALPGAHLSYLADNAWAPYGERPAEALRGRVAALVRDWRAHESLDLLVLACNTATAVAIDALRQEHPDLPIVGIEPALRPALAATRSGRVGVVATRATLNSARYQALRSACLADAAGRPSVHERAADGLADAIERGDETLARALCHRHLRALLDDAPAIDTLVLGCTHYPLVGEAWLAASEGPIALIDPAEAVARRARHLLPGAEPGKGEARPSPTWRCTGHPEALRRATRQWLDLPAEVRSPQS